MATTGDYFAGGEMPLKEAVDKVKCEPCDGWGQVLSGARNPATRVQPCTNCGGSGFEVKVKVAGEQTYQPVYGEIVPAYVDVNGGGQGPDAWQRPAGHPHYGIAPSLVGA